MEIKKMILGRRKENILLAFIGVSLILFSQLALGFGVSTPYFRDNPLILSPGESREVHLTLQNMIGGKDVIAIAEVVNGKEIAHINDESPRYEVPYGRKDVKINLTITAPEKAKNGEEYLVTVAVTTQPSDREEAGGQLQFAQGVGAEIIVQIDKPRTLNIPLIIFLIIGVLILLMAIYFVTLRRRRRGY